MSLYDDAESLRRAIDNDAEISELRDHALALVESVDALMSGSPAQRIGNLLTDENGLSLTSASLHVLVDVLLAIEAEDERWGMKSLPASPSVTDYSAAIFDRLRREYER